MPRLKRSGSGPQNVCQGTILEGGRHDSVHPFRRSYTTPAEARAKVFMPDAADRTEENDRPLQDDVDWRCNPQRPMFFLTNGGSRSARQIHLKCLKSYPLPDNAMRQGRFCSLALFELPGRRPSMTIHGDFGNAGTNGGDE